jgi:hypothetical protein
MVKTAIDILDIDPIERMEKLEEISSEKRSTIAAKKKEFEELEKSKRKELDELDKKKRKEIDDLESKKKKELDELDKKRKELSDLETKKIKEIEDTQELIEKSFQELMRHKRIILQEEVESDNKKKFDEKTNLEDMANTASQLNSNIPRGNMNYSSRRPDMLQEPQRLYDVTNNNFYTGLTELRNKAASGQITPEEELIISRLKDKFENFNNNNSYVEKDSNQYIKRSMQVIEQIGKYQRLKD